VWEVGIDPTSTCETIQTVQDQEETYPRSWSNDAPMGWNWYLALQHTKECPEAAKQESHKKQVQQELARQQAQ
jgi:hypothetical protein